MTSTNDIRRAFLDYFGREGHQVVPSAPLVPQNDPTLMFVNAGMVPFKNVFTGLETRPYSTAASSQKCVRAGGKHNDLDNVGYTARHLTFFEMLGNFSFGDYFKERAIDLAWTLLTKEFGLSPDRLTATVYHTDDEAWDLWKKIAGLPDERIIRIPTKDNFWAMGDNGPCGPCSEIFFDHGPAIPGGPPGSPNEGGDRFVEVWNLVFMQYEQEANEIVRDLPRPSIDTGMGLERISTVLQGVHSVFETNTFRELIGASAELTKTDAGQASHKVIADHLRSSCFLVGDGVLPANEGRGYVLRRIMRRAMRHAHLLGAAEPLMHRLVPSLVAEMGAAYPDLVRAQPLIEETLKLEETRFRQTLANGLRLLDEATAAMKPGETLPGATAFTGYLGHDGEGEVVAIVKDGARVERAGAGDRVTILTNQTPFYGESGGQIGDTGKIISDKGLDADVEETSKPLGKLHAHQAAVKAGEVSVGDAVQLHVDAERRSKIRANHSATHLLHAALRRRLGDHVTQKGSLVAPDYFRFDFSHNKPMTREEIETVEADDNRHIRENRPVGTRLMSMDDAISSGAMALFGEKYGDEVRVLSMGDEEERAYSVELCGGTHVNALGDIQLLKITSESAVASGVRRIEALTGEAARAWLTAREDKLKEAAASLKASPEEVPARVAALVEERRRLERELAEAKKTIALSAQDLTTVSPEIS